MPNDILGTKLADILKDTADAEIIRGLEGNDTLINKSNFDTLYGGSGDDTLRIWQPSAAFLHVVAFGDAGNDMIRLMPGCNTANIFAGDGADTIEATGGRGYFTGGNGADSISGGPLNTRDTNRILAYGDGGNDTLTGIWNAFGGEGNDLMTGCRIASAGNGRDTVSGTALGDFLSDDGTDRLRNVFSGRGGDDRITGGGGTDIIEGDGGDDHLEGEAGADSLWGGIGRDTLLGGSSNDVLRGGEGRDLLSGGSGRDVLWGEAGVDVFLFSGAGEVGLGTTSDVIKDFVSGTDHITLAFGALDFIGMAAFSKTTGEVRFESAIHRLQIDLDGNGKADAALVLEGVTALIAQDLIL